MRRLLPTLTLLLLAGSLTACSCIYSYISYDDLVCQTDTTGGIVLELVLEEKFRDFSGGGSFRVVRSHLRETDLPRIDLYAWSSCAWWLADTDRPGDRFLYFSHPEAIADGEAGLFEACGRANIFRMNRQGTRVEYPQRGENYHRGFTFLRHLPALTTDRCSEQDTKERPENPLKDLALAGNPGNGQIRLRFPDDAGFSDAQADVYTMDGRRVRRFTGANSHGDPLDLTDQAPGVYTVIVRLGTWYKTLRYVKVSG